ncbi:PPC domain-containing protein [Telmatocola sphagniphila]|uniref:PPC domain-containing protein n=1 Tax=Telmatocola sphagniphila TaxID=1123043 RepID=A0A8E6B860_9BACT|nr:PPC domain-containing protein [Telmatocola sphagniphila]QVL33658.1 PPC domain-containing protein [Telmatocola sphagniphila]
MHQRQLAAFLVLSLTSLAVAQKKPDSPAPASTVSLSPQAPVISPAFPHGLSRGTKSELKISGSKLETAKAVWASFPVQASVKAKSAQEVTLTLDVSKEASVGYHHLRVITEFGISNAILICVDDLPQVLQTSGHQDKKTPQKLTIPCVVAGKVDEDKSDWYSFTVSPGQRLSFETLGHRLGNPIDPILKLYSAATGLEIPGTYSDDPPGLQNDARITHTFAEAGEYLIEMRDTQYRGGPNHHYRLRIGDFPVGQVVEPLYIQAGKKATVQFPGASITKVLGVEVTAPATSLTGAIAVVPKIGELSGWPLQVRISDVPELLEKAPNNKPTEAMQLPVPCGVSAGFQSKGDVDYYRFPAKKGVKYLISAETFDINTPAEVYLQLLDKDQKQLAKSDPMQTTARLEYAATSDTELFIKAEHLNYLFGPAELYHLIVREDEPDFELILPLDRCEASMMTGTLLPVAIKRKNYGGEIRLSVEGPEQVIGSVVVPANSNQALLPIQLTGSDLKPAYVFGVLGEIVINGQVKRRYADRLEAVRKEMDNLLHPPIPITRQVAVAVISSPPIRGTIQLSSPTFKSDKPLECTIKLERSAAATEEVNVALVGLPEGVTANVKPIGKGETQAKFTLKVDPKLPAGRLPFGVRFTTKIAGKDMVSYSPLVESLIAK